MAPLVDQHSSKEGQAARPIQGQPTDCLAALRAKLASKQQQLQQLQQEINTLHAQLQTAQEIQQATDTADEQKHASSALAAPQHAAQLELVVDSGHSHVAEEAGAADVTREEGSSSPDHHLAAALLAEKDKAVQGDQGSRLQHLAQQLQDTPMDASNRSICSTKSVLNIFTPELSAPPPPGGSSAPAAVAVTAAARLQEPVQQQPQQQEPEPARQPAATRQGADTLAALAARPAVSRGVHLMMPQLQQQSQQYNNQQIRQDKAQQAPNMQHPVLGQQQQQQQQQQQTLPTLDLTALQALLPIARGQQQEQQQQQQASVQQEQQSDEVPQSADQFQHIMHLLRSLQHPSAERSHTLQQSGPSTVNATDAAGLLPAATAVAAQSSQPAADTSAEVAAEAEVAGKHANSAAQAAAAAPQGVGSSSSNSQQQSLHPLVATAAAATAAVATQLELRTAADWDNASITFKERCFALAAAAAKQQTAAGVDLDCLGWEDIMLLMQPVEDELSVDGYLGTPIDVTRVVLRDKPKGPEGSSNSRHARKRLRHGSGSSGSTEAAGQDAGSAAAGAALVYYDFAQYFMLPADAAAQAMGMGLTKFKTKIRELGIARWPCREYKAIEEAIDFLHSKGDEARDHALKPMRILLLKHLRCLLDKYTNMNFDAHPARDLIDALHKQKYKKRKQDEKDALLPATANLQPAGAVAAVAAASAGQQQVVQHSVDGIEIARPKSRKRAA